MPAARSLQGKGKRPTIPIAKPATFLEASDGAASTRTSADSHIQSEPGLYPRSRGCAQSEINIPNRSKMTTTNTTTTRSNSLPLALMNNVSPNSALRRGTGPDYAGHMLGCALNHYSDPATDGFPLENRHSSHSSSTEFSQGSQTSQDTDDTNYSHDSTIDYQPSSRLGRSPDKRSVAPNDENKREEQDCTEGESYFAGAGEWSYDTSSHQNLDFELVSPRSSTHQTALEPVNGRISEQSMNDGDSPKIHAHSRSLPTTRKVSTSSAIFAEARSLRSAEESVEQISGNNNHRDEQHVGATRAVSYNEPISTKDDASPKFQLKICVWQKGRRPSRLAALKETDATLLLDTQCQDSNWVSATIVYELQAVGRGLPHPILFNVFNNQKLTASWVITLDFQVSDSRRKTYTADFFVLKDAPFDMVLGDKDIVKNHFLSGVNRQFLGLGHQMQSETVKRDEEYRTLLQVKATQEHNRRVQEQKKKDAMNGSKRGKQGGGEQKETDSGVSYHGHPNATNRQERR